MSQLQSVDINLQRWVQTSYLILSSKGYEIDCSEIDYSRSTNPLLTLSNNKQMPNIEYNCDQCDDLSSIQNCESEMSFVPDNSSRITYKFLDTYDFNGDDIKNLSNEANQQEGSKPLQSLQNMAFNRFQIMLYNLINKHKASLQMYDKICNLVNEYTSSPNFNCHSKLQSKKIIPEINQRHKSNIHSKINQCECATSF